MTASRSLELYQIDSKLAAKQEILLTKDDKVEMMEKMSKDKIDLIKWMVGLFITLALMILGIYLKKG